MMPRKDMRSIKDEDQYEALRDKGYSKSTSAAISNSSKDASRRGARHAAYEEWTREALYERARELDIAGRSEMTKSDLIEALRDAR